MVAVSRIATMAQRGVVAGRVRQAMEDLVFGWKSEPINRADLRQRFEIIQEEVDGGLVAAEDYVALAETDAELRLAEAQYDALVAIRNIVNRELAQMRLLI